MRLKIARYEILKEKMLMVVEQQTAGTFSAHVRSAIACFCEQENRYEFTRAELFAGILSLMPPEVLENEAAKAVKQGATDERKRVPAQEIPKCLSSFRGQGWLLTHPFNVEKPIDEIEAALPLNEVSTDAQNVSEPSEPYTNFEKHWSAEDPREAL